jgi:glycosyltransferase involved in cell wall biosynthesis
MGAAPLVSVVVPTNNREGLLRQTVASILAQDLRDFELIIVDNVSTDGTEAYVQGARDPRIRYFRNANGGIPAISRNFGIRHALGEYVAFCDDDDLWLPGKLSRQVDALKRAPAAGLCFTNGIAFRDSSVVAPDLVAGKKHLLRRNFAGLLMENTIPSCSVMVRRSTLEAAGLFDESADLVAVEDWELWLRIARRSSLAYLDDRLVRYRIHENLSAKPSVTVLRGMTAIRSVTRKLGVSPFLSWAALAYHWLKYGWFRISGR